jgi:hypothetical protein
MDAILAIADLMGELMLCRESQMITDWLVKRGCPTFAHADHDQLVELAIALEKSLEAKDNEWRGWALRASSAGLVVARKQGWRRAVAAYPPIRRWRDRYPKPTTEDMKKLAQALEKQLEERCEEPSHSVSN